MHTTEEKSCCNCANFAVPNEKCKEGIYTTRDAICGLWKENRKEMKMGEIVVERSKANKCPICDKELLIQDEVGVVEYRGQKVLVHKEHVRK